MVSFPYIARPFRLLKETPRTHALDAARLLDNSMRAALPPRKGANRLWCYKLTAARIKKLHKKLNDNA